jgi:hypothetical protein
MLQADSQIGGTISVPVSRCQSTKFGYCDGALTRIGETYQNGFDWMQYSWIAKPR